MSPEHENRLTHEKPRKKRNTYTPYHTLRQTLIITRRQRNTKGQRDTPTHRNTYKHRQKQTQTQRHTQTYTHRHRHGRTDTHTHTQIQTHTQIHTHIDGYQLLRLLTRTAGHLITLTCRINGGGSQINRGGL